jgi:hypothetical protein
MTTEKNYILPLCIFGIPLLVAAMMLFRDITAMFMYFSVLVLFICIYGFKTSIGWHSARSYLVTIILLSTLLRLGLLFYTFSDNVCWINNYDGWPYIGGDFSTYEEKVNYLLDSYYEGAIPSLRL